jgi:hypothetical protein
MAKNKYDQLFLTEFKEPSNVKGVGNPQAYFRGARQIPGANMNMGWQVFTDPIHLEKEPHTHDFDEYLIFLAAELPDLFTSFDADIDFWIGEEMEYHHITKSTIIFIPKGMLHCPLNFKKIVKPVLFSAILLNSRFTKTMGGKEYAYDGPNSGGAGPAITR